MDLKVAVSLKKVEFAEILLIPKFTLASSEEGLEMCGLNSITQTNIKTPVSRNNTALHVCWHRGITISLEDHIKSSEVCMQLLFLIH